MNTKFNDTFGRFLLTIITLTVANLDVSWARPEYAIQHNINRCTACHISPIGGGTRNLNGKQYGSHQLGLSPFAKQDYFSADVRMVHYDPGKTTSRSGMGLMAGLFSLNAPISPSDDSLMLSYTHNIGGWTGTDSAFFRWKNSEDTATSWAPQYILVGRFHAPFGPLTDEHRTYTQIQTKNSWNLDFEMGALISANPSDNFHYDIAVVNGEKAAGSIPTAGRAGLWGTIGNFRFMPQSWPLMLGASTTYHNRNSPDPSPWAHTIYGVTSLSRLTNYKFKGSFTFQYARAKYWNKTINNFITDAAYQTSVENSESEGWYGMLMWDIAERWSLVYKYDQLVLDMDYPSDAYIRHGVGFRHLVAPNGYFSARYEMADANHPSEEHGTGIGALDGFWLLLQISI